MNWSDITLRQFNKLQDIFEVEDSYTVCNIIDLIWGIDSSNLPLNQFIEYKEKLEFLKQPITPIKNIPLKITVNNRTYNTNVNLTEIKVAQYIDYQNYCKNPKYNELLSVFIIPEGHNYNDGYDLQQVKEDILDLPIDLVYGINFFFLQFYLEFIRTFLYFFKKELKTMNLTQEKKKQIQKELQVLEQSLISQEYVENLMKTGIV